KQELYYARKHGLESHLARAGYSTFQYGINSIDGRLRFLTGIERPLATKFRAIWASVLAASPHQPGPTYDGAPQRGQVDLFGFVDTTTLKDGRVAMALVLTSELAFLETTARSILEDLAEDPWVAGRAKKLEAKGLHFTD